MSTKPSIENYHKFGDYRSTRIMIGPLTIWYSYATVVAFRVDGYPRVVHENKWSKTTGKHLNAIDDGGRQAKKARLSDEAFDAAWADLAEPLLLNAAIALQRMTDSDDYRTRFERRRPLIDRAAAKEGSNGETRHAATDRT